MALHRSRHVVYVAPSYELLSEKTDRYCVAGMVKAVVLGDNELAWRRAERCFSTFVYDEVSEWMMGYLRKNSYFVTRQMAAFPLSSSLALPTLTPAALPRLPARHQSQREPPDGHLRSERQAVHDADGSLPAALGETDGHSRRLAACHGSYQYPRRAWCGWELRLRRRV